MLKVGSASRIAQCQVANDDLHLKSCFQMVALMEQLLQFFGELSLGFKGIRANRQLRKIWRTRGGLSFMQFLP